MTCPQQVKLPTHDLAAQPPSADSTRAEDTSTPAGREVSMLKADAGRLLNPVRPPRAADRPMDFPLVHGGQVKGLMQ